VRGTGRGDRCHRDVDNEAGVAGRVTAATNTTTARRWRHRTCPASRHSCEATSERHQMRRSAMPAEVGPGPRRSRQGHRHGLRSRAGEGRLRLPAESARHAGVTKGTFRRQVLRRSEWTALVRRGTVFYYRTTRVPPRPTTGVHATARSRRALHVPGLRQQQRHLHQQRDRDVLTVRVSGAPRGPGAARCAALRAQRLPRKCRPRPPPARAAAA